MDAAKFEEFMTTVQAWGPSIAKINGIDLSLSNIERKIDQINVKIEEMNVRISSLEAFKGTATTDVLMLREECDVMKAEINKLQQQALSNDLIINGLPPSVTNNDIASVLENLGHKIDCPISINDFVGKPRAFHTRDKTSTSIIGTFATHTKKANVLSSFKAKRPIPVEDIVDLPASSTLRGKQVQLRNNLTLTNRTILAEAFRIKGTKFTYAWDIDGRIHLRKDNNERPIEIRSLEHLHDVVSKAT